MNWKPSKRQEQLKIRLIKSSRVYWSTSHKLNKMLLKMLHNNNVYTPDDLYNRYVSHKRIPDNVKPVPNDRHAALDHNDTVSRINRTLKNLNSVLIQLKSVINKIVQK